MSAIWTLACKDLRLLVRDRFALFWILAFPLMYALFFGSIFGSSGEGGRGAITLTIVDEDGSAASADLAARLARHKSVRLTRTGEGPEAPFESLTLQEAREAVQKGRRAAYLRIGAGFGENPYAIFGGAPDAGVLLTLGIDPGRSAEAGFLQGLLMESLFGALQERFMRRDTLQADLAAARAEVAAAEDISAGQKLVLGTFLGAVSLFVDQFDLESITTAGDGAGDGEGATAIAQPGGPGAMIEVVDVSRDRSKQPRSTWDITFPQALVWGLLSVALTFAVTIVRERSSGTLQRLYLAPIGRPQLLAGKALGCFLGCLATMSFLLAFAVLALGVRVDSPPLLAVGMICIALCLTGLMMVVSVMGRTENAVAGGSWGLLMPLMMIGGGMIPLIAMPEWLLKVSVISPFKWAITVVEGAVWRGFTPADMAVPCLVLLGMGAVCFTIGALIFRRLDG